MNRNATITKVVAVLLYMSISSACYASTVYVAEINPAQSSGYIEGADPYQISGHVRVIVEGATIRFENIDLVTSPTDVASALIVAASGSYDGFNFEYNENPPSLPVLGNSYTGTFDGNALYMQGTTYNGTLYDFTMNSSSVAAVPLPGGLPLFLSGLFGFFLRARRRTSNHAAQPHAA